MRLTTTGSFLAIASVALPALASAQTIINTLGFISTILNGLIGLFITLAIVVFFWGLVKYLWSMSNEDAHEGLKIMFWIALLQRSFNVQGGAAITPALINFDKTGPGGLRPGGN
ncbi:MAG: hypothetical protein UY39_C0063G0007 [Candidatus Kaiserbacteria bacterium GW2011_GWC2_49_12]|uniref:Uncharacterized protein n=1 Tax=Candidatus Kaiserbacteria bacterium GW2011_GWC2_49_12 TaxID=1618675 RepID=A0A0G1YG56_9BACT|nr:MAG: hypothetical protein UY39_C0063G0007 [Candidatus Kaiserbacteria bacterium GW2011_GWC2_49_12]